MKKNKKNLNQLHAHLNDQSRDDKICLQGTVEEALPGTLFQVKCDGGILVLCTLSGKLRLNKIRILPGDNVAIEVSPYDTSRGRIMWRVK